MRTARAADAMGLQKDHDLANDFLLGPGIGDAPLALATNARECQQLFRVVLDDVEHPLAKGLDQFMCEMRPYTLDHPGAQITLNALQCTGRNHAQLPRLELQAMLAVVDPAAAAFDVLAGRYAGCGADHRDQLALPAHLHP